MKNIFSIHRSAQSVDIALFLVRIGIAALMLTHGVSKIALYNESPIEFINFLGLGAEISLALAIFAEIGCSIFILLGLGTRVAVIPLIITMLVAVFLVHSDDPFTKQEMGLHYLLVYIYAVVDYRKWKIFLRQFNFY